MPPKAKSKAKPATSDDDQDDKQLRAQQASAFKLMIESVIGATTKRVDSLVKEVADLKYSMQYSQKDIDSQKIVLGENIVVIQSIGNQISWEESDAQVKSIIFFLII